MSDWSKTTKRELLSMMLRKLDTAEAHDRRVLSILTHMENSIMSQLQDLTSAVTAVTEAEASMEQRIDTLIQALKAPADSPEVAAAITSLEAVKAKLGTFEQPPVDASASTSTATDAPASGSADAAAA